MPYSKEYYKKNIEKIRAYREKNRVAMRLYQREMNRKIRLMILEHYSGGLLSCACCYESTYEFLSIDHINNDGAAHRRNISKNKTGKNIGSRIYRWIIRNNFPPIFQVLCHNCNLAKGFYGKCPHSKKLDK